MTRNQLAYWELQETKRANLVKENQNAQQIAEQRRANEARELETFRSNTARESENHRSNLAQENLSHGNLLELTRAHQVNEDIGYRNVGLGYSNLAETSFANRRNEAIRTAQNVQNNLLESRRITTQRQVNAQNARESRSRTFSNYANVVGIGATKVTSLLRRLVK